jgi:hypothetical protein
MNRELILFAFVFAASCLLCTKASKQELDSLDDQIAFRIQFKAAKEFSDINEVQQENLLKIVSAENEEYQCVLPDVIENVAITYIIY